MLDRRASRGTSSVSSWGGAGTDGLTAFAKTFMRAGARVGCEGCGADKRTRQTISPNDRIIRGRHRVVKDSRWRSNLSQMRVECAAGSIAMGNGQLACPWSRPCILHIDQQIMGVRLNVHYTGDISLGRAWVAFGPVEEGGSRGSTSASAPVHLGNLNDILPLQCGQSSAAHRA
jgi:hypothetical protein